MASAGMQQRKGERGVSFLLVVAGMFAILAMAALSVDLVMMYSARAEAQKAADAAALAGAKMFVTSGITSGSGLTNICTGAATDAANQMAIAVAGANQVGGTAATVSNVACDLTTANNPQITVTVSRTNLPTFLEGFSDSPIRTSPLQRRPRLTTIQEEPQTFRSARSSHG